MNIRAVVFIIAIIIIVVTYYVYTSRKKAAATPSTTSSTPPKYGTVSSSPPTYGSTVTPTSPTTTTTSPTSPTTTTTTTTTPTIATVVAAAVTPIASPTVVKIPVEPVYPYVATVIELNNLGYPLIPGYSASIYKNSMWVSTNFPGCPGELGDCVFKNLTLATTTCASLSNCVGIWARKGSYGWISNDNNIYYQLARDTSVSSSKVPISIFYAKVPYK